MGGKFWQRRTDKTCSKNLMAYSKPIYTVMKNSPIKYSYLRTCRWIGTTWISHNQPIGSWECFFVLSRAWDKEKVLSPHKESNLRPSDSALRCSTTEPQRLFEVHMTRVLHTAGISNVDGVMFVDRNKSKLFRNLLPPILIHFKYALYLGALIMQIIMCLCL